MAGGLSLPLWYRPKLDHRIFEMTEFELGIIRNSDREIILLLGEGVATHITIYFTIVSAFLVVAFMAGQKLTTLQVYITTTLYSLAYILETLVLASYLTSHYYSEIAYRDNYPGAHTGFTSEMGLLYMLSALAIMTFVASLWFMWSVRHPKPE